MLMTYEEAAAETENAAEKAEPVREEAVEAEMARVRDEPLKEEHDAGASASEPASPPPRARPPPAHGNLFY